MLFLPKKEIPLRDFIPHNYIDIHSHILPGIDDGVKTIYEAAFLIEKFASLGIKKIITTPHIMQQVWPNTSEIITQKLSEIQALVNTLDIPSIEILAGAEYMLDDLFQQRLKNKDILPIANTYVLIEMSTFSAPLNLNELLFEIKLAGYTPLLAHPERYTFYNSIKEFEALKRQGVLFQMNLLSLSGYYEAKVKETAIKLMNAGFMDFTGSDIHNNHQFETLEKGFPSKLIKKLLPIMQRNRFFNR